MTPAGVPIRDTFWNVPPLAQNALYLGGLVAVAIFLYGVYRHVRLWRAGPAEDRFDNIPQRVKLVAKHALGQARTRMMMERGFSVFVGQRKRDPQLVEAQRLALEGAAVVPHAVAGSHPFQSARNDLAFLSGGVLIEDPACKHCGEGRNARVRVNSGE